MLIESECRNILVSSFIKNEAINFATTWPKSGQIRRKLQAKKPNEKKIMSSVHKCKNKKNLKANCVECNGVIRQDNKD